MSPHVQHLIYLSEVPIERLRWLSPGRLARGKLTILDGDPGLGKSTLLCDWAARVTLGEALPGGEPGEPRGVVLLSAEDGLADTIAPRLAAAGADLDRVAAIVSVPHSEEQPDGPPRWPTIPDDVKHLAEAIVDTRAALVVIDPFVAYLSRRHGSHNDQEVRQALAPLAQLAEGYGVAVVLVRHLNKNRGGVALYRGGGSIGIIGAARCGLLLARDPDDPDRRILASTKSNLAEAPPALAFRLERVPHTDVARVVWAGESDHTAETLLAVEDDEPAAERRDANAEWLRALLADGPLPAVEVKARARQAGIPPRTLDRLRQRVGVVSRRVGFGNSSHFELALPPPAPPDGAAPPASQPALALDAPAPAPEAAAAPTARCIGCGAPLPPDRDAFCEDCGVVTWLSPEAPAQAEAP